MDKFFKIAKRMGIRDCEFFHSCISSTSFFTSKNEIRSKEYDFDEGWGVRVLEKGKLGFAFFERREDCAWALRTAKSLSKFSEKSDFSFPPPQKYTTLRTFDKRIENLEEEEGVELVSEMLEGISRYAKPTECYLEYAKGFYEIQNSEGLYAKEKRTAMLGNASANYRGSSAHETFGSIFLEKDMFKVGEKGGKLAKEMHRARMLKTEKRTLIFEQEAIDDLLLPMLLPSLNGERVRRGISKLCGKIGKEIAPPMLSIYDEPLAPALKLSAFDGEGIASRRTPLVEKGILRNFLYDLKTAALAKVDAKGNCARADYSSPPVIAPSNIVIKPGTSSDLAREFKNAVIVKSFTGTHTANPITGDFSVNIEIGFEVRKGELLPIRGNVLRGNIFDVLTKVCGIEKTQKTFLNLISPRIAISEMEVVGS